MTYCGKRDDVPKYPICPKCGEVYGSNVFSGRRCPKCHRELEDLDGFYEKHPELKDANKGKPHET